MKKLILCVALLCCLSAWAVPPEVVTEIRQHPLVHQGYCEWRSIVSPCQVFFNEAEETAYLVTFSLNGKDVTHVVKVVKGKEEVLWVNPKYVV